MDERVLFVESIISNPESRILEIGPLNRPIATKEKYPNVYYCDIRATEEIKELYTGNDYLKSTGITIDIDTIVNVDYVVSGSYQETFMGIEKFDYIIVSHVMEHMEDIIGFLQDIYKIMSSDGKLCIIYPDKRYCFDHFRVEASFRDAYDVFARGIQEVSRMTLDFFYNVVDENDAVRYWADRSLGDLFPCVSIDMAKKNYDLSLQKKKIPDVHYWLFSDRGFLKFLYDCLRAELISFTCEKFIPTQVNSQQFMVALGKRIAFKKNQELENIKHLIIKLPEEFRNEKWIMVQQEMTDLKDTVRNLQTERLDFDRKLDKKQCEIIELQKGVIETLASGNLEINNLQNKIDNLQKELSVLQKNHKDLEEVNEKLIASNLRNKVEIEEYYNAIIQQKEKEVAEQLEEIDNLKKEYDISALQIQDLLNSNSWKVMAPIRNICDFVKSIRNKE